MNHQDWGPEPGAQEPRTRASPQAGLTGTPAGTARYRCSAASVYRLTRRPRERSDRAKRSPGGPGADDPDRGIAEARSAATLKAGRRKCNRAAEPGRDDPRDSDVADAIAGPTAAPLWKRSSALVTAARRKADTRRRRGRAVGSRPEAVAPTLPALAARPRSGSLTSRGRSPPRAAAWTRRASGGRNSPRRARTNAWVAAGSRPLRDPASTSGLMLCRRWRTELSRPSVCRLPGITR